MKIKAIIFFSLINILSSLSLFSQSKLKFVKGEIFNLVEGERHKVIGLNLIINDTNTLFFSDINDYIVVESESKHIIIKAEDYYPNGFTLLTLKNNTIQNSSIGLLSKIFTALFKDEFSERKKIDNLYITHFQGVTRNIFDSSMKNNNIHLNYYSKIKWNGSKIEITFKNKLVFVNKSSKNSSYIFDANNIDLLHVCNPCSVLIDNNYVSLIYTKTLEKDLEKTLQFLDSNITLDIYPELSELLKVRIFIQNELYFNANYYIDLYEDNLMISEYLKSTRFNF